MQGLLELPADLAPLGEHLAGSLGEVAARFDAQLASDLPPVAALCRHVERYRGKMLRPTLVLLAGLAAHPEPSRDYREIITAHHVTIAAVCELVHMATLVHDDVLDEAEVRRRGATVNHLRGNEPAVILGDYLIAAAFHLCSTLPSPRASLAIGRASMTLCAGELLQLHHREDNSLDEPTYFEIIRGKTAELIAVSAELGAFQSGAPDDTCRALAAFAGEIGIAFQIQDDLLDLLGSTDEVGKSTGKDVEKGKLTLPMIHHLATATPLRRGRTLVMLEAARREGPPPGLAAQLLAEVQATGSVEYARREALRRVDLGKAHLAGLAPTPARRMLLAMADAVVDRRA